ncbi:9011_t:CDS:2, partial [Acaulospora morrowiae]
MSSSKSKDKYVKNKSLYTLPLPISLSPTTSSIFSSILAFFSDYLTSNNSAQNPLQSSSGNRKPRGTFDPLSNSVIVNGEEDIEKLWKQGFFGKGNLSRSEPTWCGRGKGELTAEQITNDPVADDATTKDNKADNISPNIEGTSHVTGDEDVKILAEIGDIDENKIDHKDLCEKENYKGKRSPGNDVDDKNDNEDGQVKEHLQLTTEEAFFLCFGIGSLDIYDFNKVIVSSHRLHLSPSLKISKRQNLMTIQECWNEFRIASIAHHSTIKDKQPSSNVQSDDPLLTVNGQFDNPFVIRYVAFHYFRSLGWVVGRGNKFGTDFVLYEKGPVFKHAEYGVVVLPCHNIRNDDSNDLYFRQNVTSSWQSMMNLTRVCGQVKKSLVFCHVIIPVSRTYETSSNDRNNKIISSFDLRFGSAFGGKSMEGSLKNILEDPLECLRNYKIREV